MFGKVREAPQTEPTPFHPRSPYGVAKVYGHWITVNYRESYGLFACSGSSSITSRRGAGWSSSPARSPTGSRASSAACSRAAPRKSRCARDWGFAGDYVRAMWLMLQQDEPDDYVVATGETHSVQELVESRSRAPGSTGGSTW